MRQPILKQFIQKFLNAFGYSLHRKSTVDALIHFAEQSRKRQESSYAEWSRSVFGFAVNQPDVQLATSFPGMSEWGEKFYRAMIGVELEYVDQLLIGIREGKVEGELVEFGIFEGWWINYLYERSEALGLTDRKVIGFDSFQGLSDPHPVLDHEFWKKGQYAAGRSLVEERVQAKTRPRIQLIEGFFADSLVRDDALQVGKIAYARIDCDIYEPALQCLNFLSSRLAHGAILVFDDWPHQMGVGETLAFAEWVPNVPRLRFEFLFFGPWGHFYIRVWHRGQEHAAA